MLTWLGCIDETLVVLFMMQLGHRCWSFMIISPPPPPSSLPPYMCIRIFLVHYQCRKYIVLFQYGEHCQATVLQITNNGCANRWLEVSAALSEKPKVFLSCSAFN